MAADVEEPQAPPEEEVPAEEAPEQESDPPEGGPPGQQPDPIELAEGWLLVHQADEERIVTSETQGEGRVIPPQLRAEKLHNGINVQAFGETEEQLQAAIEAMEANWAAAEVETEPAAEEYTPVSPRLALSDESPDPVAEQIESYQYETVITPEGRFTEAEWSGRHKTDTIVDDEGQVVFSGTVSVEAGANGDGDVDPAERYEQITDEDFGVSERQAEIEHARGAEEPIESEQVVYDTDLAIDSPGQSAGGTLVISADAEDRDDAVNVMNAQAAQAENERVAESEQAGFRPVEDINLTGLDVGLAHRGDLASERPPQGGTYDYVEGLADIEEQQVPGLSETQRVQAQVEQDRIEAIKDTRDEQEPADQDEEQRQAAIEAAAAAEEEGAAEEAAPPDATAGAKAAADELGVDLNEVEGTGTDGRITKGDVEQHAAGSS